MLRCQALTTCGVLAGEQFGCELGIDMGSTKVYVAQVRLASERASEERENRKKREVEVVAAEGTGKGRSVKD